MIKSIADLCPDIYNLSGKELFIELMTTTKVEILFLIGKFIHQAFKNSM